MRPDTSPDVVWESADYQAIFAHLLQTRLCDEFEAAGAGAYGVWAPLANRRLIEHTFGAVLHEPGPAVGALEAVKAFAKAGADSPDRTLPRDVLVALYVTSIVAARLRYGVRLTRLSDAAMGDRVRAVLEFPWLDSRTRKLLEEWMSRF